MAPLKICHIFTAFQSLGGVESVLKHHQRQDGAWGLDSRFIILSEPHTHASDKVAFLGFTSHTTVKRARTDFQHAVDQSPAPLAVYHTPWSMPYLAGLDQSSRRILVLHTDVPGLRDSLTFRRDWLDGVLCVSEPLLQMTRECIPSLAAERMALLPYPIFPPAAVPSRTPNSGRPLVLGFCGRLTVEQKRIDRLPELCRHLDQAGLNYRMEFLGEGRDEDWLKGQLAERQKFEFYGRQSGDAYWRILANWDAILFTSDFEGTPISLLEALAVGTVPVFPAIGTGGDSYVHKLSPDFLYAPGNLAALANILVKLNAVPATEMQRLRASCRRLVEPHIGDGYHRQFSTFAGQIMAWPRVSKNNFQKLPFLLGQCSFAMLNQLGKVRRAFRRLRQ